MIQLLLNGLAMGAIYSLVALGFVVIANAVNVVNFAQGENVMLGAYVAAWLTLTMHVPLLAAYILSIAALAVYGYVFQKAAYYPLRKKPFITVVVSTIGVSLFLKNVARIIWGPRANLFRRTVWGQDRPGWIRIRESTESVNPCRNNLSGDIPVLLLQQDDTRTENAGHRSRSRSSLLDGREGLADDHLDLYL